MGLTAARPSHDASRQRRGTAAGVRSTEKLGGRSGVGAPGQCRTDDRHSAAGSPMGYCSCHAHSAAAKAHALAEWRQRLESRADGADAAGALAPPRAARAVAGASNASKGVGATGIRVDVLCQRPEPTAASFTAAVLVVVEAVARADRLFFAVPPPRKSPLGRSPPRGPPPTRGSAPAPPPPASPKPIMAGASRSISSISARTMTT